MKNKFNRNILLLIGTVFCSCIFVSAQGFKGIIPLESNCEDVKRILKVDKCTFPQSIYFLKDFWIRVNFVSIKSNKTDKICYKVPVGNVTSITVSYNKKILLSEFEYKLKYAEGPFGDIDTFGYESSEKGVSVLVNEDMFGNKVISTASFIPTIEQHRKFSYECNKKLKK